MNYPDKNSERRAQYQAKRLLLSESNAEPHPILSKNEVTFIRISYFCFHEKA